MEKFEEKIASDEHENALKAVQKFKTKEYTFKFSKDTVLGIEGLSRLVIDQPTVFDKMKGYNALNETANQDIPAYFRKLEEYCKKEAVHSAYAKAYPYVKVLKNSSNCSANAFT